MQQVPETHKPKVLIIDDNRTIRYLLRLSIPESRFQLFEADCSEKALPIIRQEKPNFIILDIMMPGDMDGFELCQLIKSWPDAKQYTIILLTARTQQADFERGQKVGADFYLTKPFSPTDLMHLLDGCLQNTHDSTLW